MTTEIKPTEVSIGNPLCIMIASPKGGVGKTAFTYSAACELQRRGYTVILCDCDPDGHLYRMWEKRPDSLEHIGMLNEKSLAIDPEKEIPIITEQNFSRILSEAKESADNKTIILVDMPGQASLLFKEVVFEVDLILTPMTISEADVSSVYDMKQLVDRSTTAIQRKIPDYTIPHITFFNRTKPAIVTKTCTEQLKMVMSIGAPVMKNHFHDRDSFSHMSFTGLPAFEQMNQGKAADNVSQMVNDVLAYMDGADDILINPANWFQSSEEVSAYFQSVMREIVGLPIGENDKKIIVDNICSKIIFEEAA